jgi:LmbE family N-acetylglucosaminyl deacetylase
MEPLSLSTPNPAILCLGAHSDDIEIGAGGTIIQLLESMPTATVWWIVFSGSGERADEARRSAELFAGERLSHFEIHDFRDGFFPDSFREVKERLRSLDIDPDLIFTHWRGDAHQDHRLIAELTRQTFRDHLILEYEILKYDGDIGTPNVYVPLAERHATRKVEYLMEAFPSQRSKHWFNESVFQAMMTIRGVECRSPYAEAFHGSKLVVRG